MKLPPQIQISEKRYTDNDLIEQFTSQSIRWRYKTDDNGNLVRDDFGQPVVESNAKLVKWSDDTYQLYVGGTKADGSNTLVYEISKNKLSEKQNFHLFATTKQSSVSLDIGKISQIFSLQPLSEILPIRSSKAYDNEEKKRTVRLTKAKIPISESERQLRDFKKKLKNKRQRTEDDFTSLNVNFLEQGIEGEEETGKKQKKSSQSKSMSRTQKRMADIQIDEDDDDYDEDNIDEYEEEDDEEEYEVQESDDDYEDTTYNPGNKRKRK